ncbi:hypothetical protein EC844_12640 [Acinetobacter calcoaceticus]|uniref:Uncharacterized protein n=1 Tax=Acinetobacter calcoaceticus TaxID=471 RepID=A0A4R1XFJ7_ACICA|nr:hypothetical protein EC844_12640 [Acinetobacter calcoaceticus]
MKQPKTEIKARGGNSQAAYNIYNKSIRIKSLRYSAAPFTWSDLNDESLLNERELCKTKIWKLRLKRVFPILLGVFGALLNLYCLLKFILPNMFSISSSDIRIVFIVLFFGIILPVAWQWWIKRQDAQLLMEYKNDFQTITIILRKRGVL